MTVDQLINKLEEIYKGDPWHGASIVNLISSVPAKNFLRPVPPGEKTIAHLLEHMIAWRQYAIQKVRNVAKYSIQLNSDQDWPEPRPTGDPKVYYTNLLDQNQQELISLLETKKDAWLDETTLNKSHNNHFLIQGIVEHDLYHSGQIGLFNSLLNAQNSSN